MNLVLLILIRKCFDEACNCIKSGAYLSNIVLEA